MFYARRFLALFSLPLALAGCGEAPVLNLDVVADSALGIDQLRLRVFTPEEVLVDGLLVPASQDGALEFPLSIELTLRRAIPGADLSDGILVEGLSGGSPVARAVASVPSLALNQTVSLTLRPIGCGDGVLDPDEGCDDGDQNSSQGACLPDCTPARCGDAVLQPGLGEACDDGNTAVGDGCDAACQVEQNQICGDGVVQAPEECDDGENNSNTLPDACRTDCTTPGCGDGVIDSGEACDDGPLNALAGPCLLDCTAAGCGDFILQPGEECDDGNTASGDGCDALCVLEPPPGCGDGVIGPGEDCDDGDQNSNILPDACRTNCQSAFCGDGVLDSLEACDNGEANSLQGPCLFTCELAACGDGIFQPGLGETCDDGNTTSGDGCDALCVLEPPPGCGDGTVDTGEECDDGFNNSDTAPDACRTNCQNPRCGDGATDSGEGCDDGGANALAGPCLPNCQPAACGDGVFQSGLGETCDDGNNTDGDGCSATCFIEPPAACGDGVIQAPEECDDGENNSDQNPDACRTNCVLARCGDGVTDNGEGCDDGGANALAGPCLPTCQPAACGDGVFQSGLGETCDDGNNLDGDGCDAACLSEAAPTCGDGILQGFEQCDEGANNSDQNPDACRSVCVLPRCGDGVTDNGEGCDDGGANALAGPCLPTCQPAACGDGVFQPDLGEQCDDGNIAQGDGCSDTCAIEVPVGCGDGILQGNEQCDDGALNSNTLPDRCRLNCTLARCGDGTIDTGEVCDDGGQNALAGPCLPTCALAECGDGVRQPNLGESCDDGNTTPGDGCSAQCLIEDPPNCGDGVTQTAQGEQCDDGNTAQGDGCSSLCRREICGDSVFQPTLGEQCDDGNTTPGDGCDTICLFEFCGDSIINNVTETCDDGNFQSGDGCSFACQIEICGNGQIDVNEECDDANTASGDGCSSACLIEFDFFCGGAAPVGAGELVSGDTTGLSDIFTGSCQFGGAPEQLFLFTPPQDGDLRLTLTSDADLGVYVRTDCADAGSELGCADEEFDVGAVESLTVGIPGGVPATIFVDGNFSGEEGPFTLQVDFIPAVCGDGVLLDIEECDDGNTTDSDGCSSACLVEFCGDGIHQPSSNIQVEDLVFTWLASDCGEVNNINFRVNGSLALSAPLNTLCDCVPGIRVETVSDPAITALIRDGENIFTVDFDGTSADFAWAVLTINGSLTQDVILFDAFLGGDAEEREPDLCNASTSFNPGSTFAVADVGILEECDDANTTGGDGCGPTCLFEGCGNGFVDAALGEECDDANTADGDGCTSVCTSEGFQIVALTADNCSTFDHSSLTGDDRGGIALSSDRVLYTGDTITGSFDIANLATNNSAGLRYDAIFSDLAAGKVYTLVGAGGPIQNPGGTITALQEIDPLTGAFSGVPVPLSTPLTTGGDTGIFSGVGRLVLLTGNQAFDINIATGQVISLGFVPTLSHAFCENWAYWGVAESFGGQLFVTYIGDFNNQIQRTRLPDGLTTTLATFTDLSDMCSFVVSPFDGRWYFHHEGSSQFTSGSEVIGFCDALVVNDCGNGAVEGGEECDDGNLAPGDGCSPFCIVEGCGNNFLDPDEECDDGNLLDGDGCSSLCASEDLLRITSLTPNNCTTFDSNSLTGDDRGGIALSSSRVLYTGDTITGSFDLDVLTTNGALSARYDALFSDLDTGKVYTLATGETPIQDPGGTVSAFLEIDPFTGDIVGSPIPLATPFFAGGGTGIFSGKSRVVIHNGGEAFDIRLPGGQITPLGSVPALSHISCETWAYWGVAEFFGNQLFVAYIGNFNNQIQRTHLPSGATSTIATFSNLSDMCSFTVLPKKRRWYFHHEGTSQLASGTEIIGFCDAAFVPPLCGNATVDQNLNEECDDGDNQGGDGCSEDCLLEVCGDGRLEVGEGCDDGNLLNNDGCSDTCAIEACGDGVVQSGEECDDGNTTAGDGCGPACLNEVCGNGFLDPGEECDDGNITAEDGCSDVCVVELCGDGTVQEERGVTEVELIWLAHDCGNVTSLSLDINGAQALSAPLLAGCVCTPGIRSEVITDPSITSLVQDGQNDFRISFDSSSGLNFAWAVLIIHSATTQEFVFFDANGGGHAEARELNSCNAGTVSSTEHLFSPSLVVGEECDDTNLISGDGCSDSCGLEVCGNSRVDFAEECDDGNLIPGDGCDASCLSEEFFQITSLTADNCSTFDHNTLTGNDRGGIALSSERVLYTGDTITGSFDIANLATNNSAGLRYDGLFSDLATERVYTLATNSGPTPDLNNTSITSIQEIDPVTGSLLGAPLPLSQSITLPNGTGVFSGMGRLILHTGSQAFDIDINTGQVTDLGSLPSFPHRTCRIGEYWGVAEFFAGELFVVYVDGNTVRRTRLRDGETTTLASFSSLSDMCSIVVSPYDNRWYFHYEGNAQFANGAETIGFCDASSAKDCGDGVLDTGEECDDGNNLNGDGCSAACRNEVCGNGILDAGEECDDANLVSGDGCSDVCISEDLLKITALTPNNCSVVDSNALTGDDRGGIALSSGRVLYTGDTITGSFDIDVLTTNGALSARYDGLFSDLATGKVYSLANNNTPLQDPGGTISTFLEIDPFTGDVIGDPIPLSISFFAPVGTGIFSGKGRVVLHTVNEALDINIATGQVRPLGLVAALTHTACEVWAYWGVAEFFDGQLFVSYVANSTSVRRTHLPSGVTSTIATFSNLSDTCSFTVLPEKERWYFHHEGNSQLGIGAEVTGFCDATFIHPLCGDGIVNSSVGEACDDGGNADGDGCSADCQVEVCGDGSLEGAEECDDGNTAVGDGCSDICLIELCGDGVVNNGEDCDDTNVAPGDGCGPTCLFEVCGNGFVDAVLGEQCDDGNLISGDGCDAVCIIELCGDGIVNNGEDCEDGNTTAGDACGPTCLFEVCGNGFLDTTTGEQCDDGNVAAGDGCSDICLIELCGDGIIQIGEDCDDGNTAAGDACGPTCLLEVCGNGFVDTGEECDDANSTDGDGCQADCSFTCGSGVAASARFFDVESGHCYLQFNTALTWQLARDDCAALGGHLATISSNAENNIVGDLSTSELWTGMNDIDFEDITDGVRGNDFVWVTGETVTFTNFNSGEPNDSGGNEDCIHVLSSSNNLWNDRPCTTGLRYVCELETPLCGNGFSEAGEECDDGNLANDDGCSDVCTIEVCGDGVIQIGEDCEDGNFDPADGCGPACLFEVCGNGFIDLALGEECDDGNLTVGDGCDAVCLTEDFFHVSALTAENCTTFEHNFLTGDDQGGIALSSGRVLYNGDTRVGSFDKNALSLLSFGFTGAVNGLFSDLGTGRVYTLANADSPVGIPGTVTSMLELDPKSGAVLARTDLSLSLSPPAGTGIFSGKGRVVLHTGSQAFDININTGQVTDLGSVPSFEHVSCENGEYWGVVELFDGQLFVSYVANSTTIRKTRLLDGATTTLGLFSNLGDMCSIVVSPYDNRWYFQYEGNAQFTNGTETIGFCDADATPFTCGDSVLDTGEECDDANNVNADGCSESCGLEVCGNGVVQFAEECDDGNLIPGDGCDTSCLSEEFFQITSLTADNCSTFDHNTLTGDDRGGIALSSERVLYTGDTITGSFDIANLATNNSAGLRYDGLFSDLATEQVYTLATGFGPVSDINNTTITSIQKIDSVTGSLLGAPLPLSQSITLPNGTGIFSGMGRLILHTGSQAFDIDINTGQVTDLGSVPSFAHRTCEIGEYWGVAEFFAGEFFVVYVDGNSIRRTRLRNGETTTLASFSSLSDMCSLVVSPYDNRWYFQYEGNAQFANGAETIGFCDATSAKDCGDGVLDTGEECDDANNVNADGCSAACRNEVCGDGRLEVAEECDDGNVAAGDGCSDTCVVELCGDGTVQAGIGVTAVELIWLAHDCGNVTSLSLDINGTQALSAPLLTGCTCTPGIRSETITDPALTSLVLDGDNQFTISFDSSSGLAFAWAVLVIHSATTQEFVFFDANGGGHAEARELNSCNAGNVSSTEHLFSPSLVVGEECDDTNLISGDGCSDSCGLEVCGNSRVDFAEECDDGNAAAGDGCSDACIVEFCGDGIVNNGEDCDDTNFDPGDGCGPTCLFEACGNGFIDTVLGEECDDGNLTDGDGCDAVCLTEDFFHVSALTAENCTTFDTNFLTGDDRGGIALSSGRVLSNGDTRVGSFDKNALSLFSFGFGGVVDSLFSDLGTGRVYTLANADSPVGIPGTVTSMLELDPKSGAVLARTDLSLSLSPPAGTGIFSGKGRVVLHTGSQAFDIDINTGQVTDLGSVPSFPHQTCDLGEYWGVAEFFDGQLFVSYVANSTTIHKTRLLDGFTTTLGLFENLSDMCSIVVSPYDNRWYFHHEFGSQFAPNGIETIGFCDADTTPFTCGDGSVDTDEECDDGNNVNGDGCDFTCLTEVCGNGAIQFNEECDDGNTVSGDGCDAVCLTENYFEIGALSAQNCSTFDTFSLTGDDRGGIALSSGRVLYNGDTATGSFDALNLIINQELTVAYDGLFSDLASGRVYTLRNDSGPTTGLSDTITAIQEIDPVNGDLLGSPVALSQTLFLPNGTGIFSGMNRVVLHTGSQVFDLNISTGEVTNLGFVTSFSHRTCENGEYWGIAEFFDGRLFVTYVDGNTVRRTRIPDGFTTTLGLFSNLSDMCSFVVSPFSNRWYFHHEGSSQFASGTEIIGFCDALPASPLCGNGITEASLGEECDDANTDPNDGCSFVCTLEGCGNGLVDPGEECDDANLTDGDGCQADCSFTCGSGVVADGRLLDPLSGHCYLQFNTTTEWQLAQDDCVALGGHLATISDSRENDLVGNIAATDLWIGLNDITAEGSFEWLTGETVTFLNFAANQPDDDLGSEDCAHIFSGSNNQWNDRPCFGVLPYVCELEAPICGNGFSEAGETCDDGNTAAFDGCDDLCQLEFCGDGVLQTGNAITSIDFTWLATSCDGPADISFTINGALALVTEGDNGSCDCLPGIRTATVTDPTVLALVQNGPNNVAVSFPGDNSELAWATATFNGTVLNQSLVVFDAFDGGDAEAQNPDLCDADDLLNVQNQTQAITLIGDEVCDDGNAIEGDGCDSNCTVSACGNGALDPATEECDDGNAVAGDGCDAACVTEFCGDNILQEGVGVTAVELLWLAHDCGDVTTLNFAINGSPALSTPLQTGCTCTPGIRSEIITDPAITSLVLDGDNQFTISFDSSSGLAFAWAVLVVHASNTEELVVFDSSGGGDAEARATNSCDAGTSSNLIQNFNATLDVGEECDDGNNLDGDGCGPTCLFEGCGNGFIDTVLGEECDDANLIDDDGCSSICTREGFQIVALTAENCSTFDHGSLIGDDRGGIALSADRMLYNADTAAGSFDITSLATNNSLGVRYDALFSDLATERVYTLAGAGLPIQDPGGTIDALQEIDPVSGAILNSPIPLSIPISAPSGTGIFSGMGRVVLHTGTQAFDINIATGQVSPLGSVPALTHAFCETWAYWGIAEAFGGQIFVTYVANNSTIHRTRLPDGLTSLVGSFSNLGDMCSIVVSPFDNRWYFHHEGSSQFASGSEIIGFCDAQIFNNCGDGVLDFDEECDDANNINGDGCDSDCDLEVCGNGTLDLGEECDDGNTDNNDGCNDGCVVEFCGDGVHQPGVGVTAVELLWLAHDCGDVTTLNFAINGSPALSTPLQTGCTCTPGIRSEIITDPAITSLVLDGDNQFTISFDSSSGLAFAWAVLVVHTDIPQEIILFDSSGGGDAEARATNTCDAGTSSDLVQSFNATLVDVGEECDDGNPIDGDGCSVRCDLEVCGNGRLDAGEECDDENLIDGDGCSALCTAFVSALPLVESFDDGTADEFLLISDGSPVRWQIDDFRAVSPLHALYFGDPLTQTYQNGVEQVQGSISTPFFAVPVGGATVSFQLFQETEGGVFFDELRVSVVDGGGEEVVTLLNNAQSTGGAFLPTSLTIPAAFAGQLVRIEFRFDSKDGFQNNFEGVYIDDLVISP